MVQRLAHRPRHNALARHGITDCSLPGSSSPSPSSRRSISNREFRWRRRLRGGRATVRPIDRVRRVSGRRIGSPAKSWHTTGDLLQRIFGGRTIPLPIGTATRNATSGGTRSGLLSNRIRRAWGCRTYAMGQELAMPCRSTDRSDDATRRCPAAPYYVVLLCRYSRFSPSARRNRAVSLNGRRPAAPCRHGGSRSPSC